MAAPTLLLAICGALENDPCLVQQRPPHQTQAQYRARAALLADAKAKSDAAKPALLQALNATRPQLFAPFDTYSAETLLDMFSWEFRRLPIQHNGPLDATEQTGSVVLSLPAVSADGSTVYVGSCDHKLYAVDAATGTAVWSFATGGWVHSSPALSPDGSIVYVGSYDHNLYAVLA